MPFVEQERVIQMTTHLPYIDLSINRQKMNSMFSFLSVPCARLFHGPWISHTQLSCLNLRVPLSPARKKQQIPAKSGIKGRHD